MVRFGYLLQLILCKGKTKKMLTLQLLRITALVLAMTAHLEDRLFAKPHPCKQVERINIIQNEQTTRAFGSE